MDFEVEEKKKISELNGSYKTRLVKMGTELENQELLVKMLQQAKQKLKAENDELKEQIQNQN